jgi:arginyl-tRNA synthetase
MVRLAGGKKMGSRLGNVVTAEDVLTTTAKAALSVSGVEDSRVVLGAIKYSFLKQRLGGDIVYEPEESVNILGNSGPYLQYAHARAKSILAKASKQPTTDADSLTKEERALELKLSRFAATINQAAAEMAPHILCIYLYELSQVFNRFYEDSRVVGDEREAFRLFLVKTYADRLRQGLSLLGIEAPDKL